MAEEAKEERQALAYALRLLQRQDRSEQQLRQRLQHKGYSSGVSDEVLANCRQWGYVDDVRFARHKAETLLRQGRAVGPRLRLELKRAGLAEDLCDQAAAAAEAQLPPEQVLARLMEHKFPGFCYDQADDRQKRRTVQYLQRRGFNLAMIMQQLNPQQ